MTHHPHLHCIVPGWWIQRLTGSGNPASRASSCPYGYCLGCSGDCSWSNCQRCTISSPSYGQLEHLIDPDQFSTYLEPVHHLDWVGYAKRPFSGPEAVLAYLSLYTHRVAISNRRLVAYDHDTVTFTYKDYRIKGKKRYSTMTLATDEFIRRFLIHILPQGFHRIRHFGLFANHHRKQNLLCLRRLLGEDEDNLNPQEEKDQPPTFVCLNLRRTHGDH